MRLLVTRPEPDASATTARLSERGHAVDTTPMLRIVVHPEPNLPRPPAAIVATSANAVRAMRQWATAAQWREISVYAVGDATAREARAAGFVHVDSAAGNVAALTARIAERARPDDGALLYPAARDTAGDLAAALSAKGFDVIRTEAYHAEAVTTLDDAVRARLADGGYDAVLVYSARTAAAFADVLDRGPPANLARTHLVAISEAAAAPLAARAWSSVRIAAHPDEDAVFEVIEALASAG